MKDGLLFKFIFLTFLLGVILVPTYNTPVFVGVGLLFIVFLIVCCFAVYNKIITTQ